MEVGDLAPDFEFIDRDGNQRTFHSIKGKKVIYFFPRAFTPGCTKQSCSIQESYDTLKEEGISEVFGISLDSVGKQKEFADTYNLDYIFVSDIDGSISKAYDSLQNMLIVKYSKRNTFVIGDDNKIISVLENGVRGNHSKLGLTHQGQEILDLLNT